MKVWIP